VRRGRREGCAAGEARLSLQGIGAPRGKLAQGDAQGAMTMKRTSEVARRAVALALVTVTAIACASTATPTPSAVNPAPAPAALARRPRPALDIAYTLAVADTAGHYYDVRMDVAGALPDTLQNANGRAVRFDRENGSLWRIYSAGARHVTLRYQVFANTLSGTFSVLDSAHANWNGASLFMYVVGHKPDPVRLTVLTPSS